MDDTPGTEVGQPIAPVTLPICPAPVFVIGAPRSGTTVLARALGRHPMFHAFEETQFLWDLFADDHAHQHFLRVGPAGSWLQRQGIDGTELLRGLGIGLNAMLTRRSHGKRWIDQTPAHTLLAEDLAALFPGARFLHMIRDGRRVVHSMVNYRYKFEDWSTDFTQACLTWSRCVDAAQAFADRHPDRCLKVTNERLVADPEEGFRRIQHFLAAPCDASPANYFATHRVNSSFLEGEAVCRSEELLQDPAPAWAANQRTTFWEEAGPTMVRCGFVGLSDVAAFVPEDTVARIREQCRTTDATAGQPASTGNGRRGELSLSPDSPYQELVAAIRDAAGGVLPEGATVMVVSKGDEMLVDLPGCVGWHFPRAADGEYAGFYPVDSAAAIAHLETLRSLGGQYLLLPATALWWLDEYADLREHLRRNFRCALRRDRVCLIYDLGHPPENIGEPTAEDDSTECG